MNRFVFLDRDGTVIEDPGYVHKVEDFAFISKAVEGLKLLKGAGFRFIFISNQSGISRGYYTEADFKRFNEYVVRELDKEGIVVEQTYHCPHHPNDNCDCRKPNPKFIKEAEKEFDIDLSRSYVIGDHESDVMLGKNAGTRTVYMLTGHGRKHKLSVKPDFVAKDLLQAAAWIAENEKGRITK